MPRRKRKIQKKINPDPVYDSVLVAKLVNSVMRNGKKSVAQKSVYGAFDLIKKETKKDPVDVLEESLARIKPSVEVRSRRVGGAAYQVPSPVRGNRKQSLGLRWLLASARARSNSQYHTFSEKLAAEIMEANKGEGGAVKKRQDVERMAEANRAFAHFRW